MTYDVLKHVLKVFGCAGETWSMIDVLHSLFITRMRRMQMRSIDRQEEIVWRWRWRCRDWTLHRSNWQKANNVPKFWDWTQMDSRSIYRPELNAGFTDSFEWPTLNGQFTSQRTSFCKNGYIGNPWLEHPNNNSSLANILPDLTETKINPIDRDIICGSSSSAAIIFWQGQYDIIKAIKWRCTHVIFDVGKLISSSPHVHKLDRNQNL
jgi:hypothetical protein